MHIHDIMKAADYRMVQGRDWLWDFLGKDCREVIFESYGLHEINEHYPVSAVFHCASGEVRMLTVERGITEPALRWMAPRVHDAYMDSCAQTGQEPWQEPGITWLTDPADILSEILPALHPERRPDDNDNSYLYESNDMQMITEVEEPTSDIRINE